jgi:colanic acid/amylovoran biosynthesis glycosyltransferase
VITTSRLVNKNAVGDLIASAEYLPENVHFTIIGSGKLENNLKKMVEDKGWKNRVHFLGSMEHNDLVLHLQQSQVFCRPSLSEGLGNSFLEAMAVGVPVIGTNVGGIPDFLQDGKTGWFCEVKNPQSIAEKIKYILDEKNKAEVDQVRENAKKLVTEKYNWNVITEQMRELFSL